MSSQGGGAAHPLHPPARFAPEVTGMISNYPFYRTVVRYALRSATVLIFEFPIRSKFRYIIFNIYDINPENKNKNELYPVQPSERLDIQLKIKIFDFIVHNITSNEKLYIIYAELY